MRTTLGVLVFLGSAVLAAQSIDIPVTNWTVPPYNRSSAGITTMTDITPPRVFVAVAPCRVVDTRNAPGPYGGPALATNVARTFDLNNGPCPGIPSFVDAYSLNFGGIVPSADGFLTAWPTGSAQPAVSQLNFVAGEVVANSAIVPGGTDGAINVLVNIGPTNIYIDINGYFAASPGNSATSLVLVTANTGAATGHFRNASSGCAISGCAVYGASDTSTSGKVVAGHATFGGSNSAGVFGSQAINNLTGTFPGAPSYSGAGVLGQSPNNGVLGISTFQGVVGSVISGSTELAYGVLAFRPGAAYGVFAGGDYGGTGAKSFVEPHPTDASKVIRYISLEGPEPGTYFRGRGRFERGMARIRVPEDFRMVTDEEGLTVQITPIGQMATFSVLKVDLNQILVQASRNVEFYYLVQGVRRTHRNLTSPIREGGEYVPRSADARIPAYLTEGQKELLIRNGTYNADGTVNMETASRLGWDRVWAERERPSPQPMP
jgi:hypothetical protein